MKPTILTITRADFDRIGAGGTGVQILLREQDGTYSLDMRPWIGGTWQPIEAAVEVREA